MSGEHNIPAELYDAIDKLNQETVQHGIILFELLEAIEELNRDPVPHPDSHSVRKRSPWLIGQNHNESFQQQQQQQQPHSGSLVEPVSQNQSKSVIQRDRFSKLEIRRVPTLRDT